MCQANGKLLGHYLQIQRTRRFLGALAPVIGIPITLLVVVRQGGTPAEQGTWVHPRAAVNLAMWCSPEFEVAVSGWVEDWMRGQAPAPIQVIPQTKGEALMAAAAAELNAEKAETIAKVVAGHSIRQNLQIEEQRVQLGIKDAILERLSANTYEFLTMNKAAIILGVQGNITLIKLLKSWKFLIDDPLDQYPYPPRLRQRRNRLTPGRPIHQRHRHVPGRREAVFRLRPSRHHRGVF